jgi:chemotaxis-related protein WspD
VAPDFTIVNRSAQPILGEANLSAIEQDCWNKIGVMGDRSCPELREHVHCRNCPVYSSAGQKLFEREPPPGHLAQWTERLAELETVTDLGGISTLVFRLGSEWLALEINVLVEVTDVRTIHTIPHRSNEILAGMVNIRGELELCVSLGGLLGIEVQHRPIVAGPMSPKTNLDADRLHGGSARSNVAGLRPTARLMLVDFRGQRWALQVDEVEGVSRFAPAELTNVPTTVAATELSFTKGVFWRGERRIGFLDETRLLKSLERSLT